MTPKGKDDSRTRGQKAMGVGLYETGLEQDAPMEEFAAFQKEEGRGPGWCS